MRVLKEVLVLAIIVLVFAYAARRLEGVDTGHMTAGVPPLMQSIKGIFGSDDSRHGKVPEAEAPSKPDATSKSDSPSD